MFGRKTIDPNANPIRSHEYEKCIIRFTELDSKLIILETSLKAMQTDMDNLRGRFNQRLKGLKVEEENAEKKIETINNNEFVAFG